MKAFTLIEMSIVLVIISLITAGIVSGRSLINAAKLNTVVTDFIKYETAINTFKLHYDAMPGDMIDADQYWPTTANGNGDRLISNYPEAGNFFQHLSLAEVLEGSYSGFKAVNVWVFGDNMPEGPFANTGYFVSTFNRGRFFTLGCCNNSSQKQISWLIFGRPNPFAPPQTRPATFMTLLPSQAKKVDVKMDDGKPALGKVVGANQQFFWECTDTHVVAYMDTAVYKVSEKTGRCKLGYIIAEE